MFTGIIEEVGKVKSVQISSSPAAIEIEAARVLESLEPGDSTVRTKKKRSFQAELSQETLVRTNLGQLPPGNRVNLERALLPTTRLGGHFVQGHIDGVAKVLTIESENGFAFYRFSLPSPIKPYVVEKGSIAVDGISLTVSRLEGDSFQVAIIPHTLENTNLGERRIGDLVNLECDVLAKYVESLLSHAANLEKRSGLTVEYLKERGY
ncbi:MAG: riboflavin synthase [Acidobacteria bacterium]|nr:MAG: riboflavin synthase [Acidobacteriota bacterium]